MLPFLAPVILDVRLFLPRCSKETYAMFWGIQRTAGTANLWSTKPLQALDQSRCVLVPASTALSEQMVVVFYTVLFLQMLERSKRLVSSLSLRQHCSSNRNRNCWRPGKSDLKRFRDGKTDWLPQKEVHYCGPLQLWRKFAFFIKKKNYLFSVESNIPVCCLATGRHGGKSRQLGSGLQVLFIAGLQGSSACKKRLM